jgi:predicted nucleic acid-binding protein
MEEPASTLPMHKMEALAGLYPHKTALSEDAALMFSLVHHDRKAMFEVTVTHTKYIRFYGKDERAFIDKMNIFRLPEFKKLEFVDEYPFVVMPGKSSPQTVVKALDKAFGM